MPTATREQKWTCGQAARPVWQRMLADSDLRAGVITAACAADLDRILSDLAPVSIRRHVQRLSACQPFSGVPALRFHR